MHYGRIGEAWEVSEFDLAHYPVWVRTPAHTEPVMTPLYCEFWYGLMVDGIRRACAEISPPTTLGYHWKLYKGHGYLTRAIPLDEEIPERTEKYRQNLTKIVQDPFGYCNRLFAKFDELMAPFADIDVASLSREKLMEHVHDVIYLHTKSIAIYFNGWFAITPLPALFQQLAGELTGLKATDPLYSKLTISADNPLYRSNSGIAELAYQAIQLDLTDLLSKPANEVLAAMKSRPAGQKWLEAFDKFLDANKWKLLRMYEFCEPGWFDQPELLIGDIRRYVEVGGLHKIDEDRAAMTDERDTLTEEFIRKVPDAQRAWMRTLLECSRAANYYSEGAAWHGEFKRMAFGRRCFMECGRRMAGDGTLEQPEDVFMLFTDEILSGLGNREKGRYVDLVKTRRAEWEGYKALTKRADGVPAVMGDPQKIGDMLRLDPTLTVSISTPIEDAEKVGAICVGGAGSPGTVEGIANVIWDESEFGKIKKGDIMVCPMTSATWTPLFGVIAGLICDSGGSLSHPVIVSREYGIPAVVGTGNATQKIKTGDRIRIDGNLLRVYAT